MTPVTGRPAGRRPNRLVTADPSDRSGPGRLRLRGQGGPPVDLSLRHRSDITSDVAVLEVGGEVDAYSAPKLSERIDEIVDNGEHHLVVDLGGVDFIDSTGLGVLVSGHNKARQAGGRLDLVCNVDRIIKLMRITGLDDVFVIHPSVAEAVSGNNA
jgi:anti-sigma B factor antagonist